MSYETIYRWEDKNGEGPYMNSDGEINDKLYDLGFFNMEHTAPKRPSLRQEGIDILSLPFYSSRRYGFYSREQEQDWFYSDERETLKQCGFSLVTYLVPSEYVIKGQKQCVFDCSAAIVISPSN